MNSIEWSSCVSSGARATRLTHRTRRLAGDMMLLSGCFAFGQMAVDFAYHHRLRFDVWLVLTVLAIGFPILAGAARGTASRAATALTLLFCAACPFVYAMAGSHEQLRDAFFLAVGCGALYVTTAWTMFARLARKPWLMGLNAMLAAGSVLAIIVMMSVYVWLV